MGFLTASSYASDWGLSSPVFIATMVTSLMIATAFWLRASRTPHPLIDPKLYSSHYRDWIERAAAEYNVIINQLGHTVDQFIVDHRQLAPQVFETLYEDGTRVIVNYGDRAYQKDGLRVESLGFHITAPNEQ